MSKVFVIKGHIDESGAFKNLQVDSSQTKDLHLDFAQVKSISAEGLRQFKWWMQQLGVGQLFLHNCSQETLRQLNSLKATNQLRAKIVSVKLSLQCSHCGFYAQYLAQRGQDYLEGSGDHRESLDLPQKILCPSCKAEISLGSEFNDYFSFLKHHN